MGLREAMLPGNPLEFIQRCVRERKIMWTYHVNMRMKHRFIPRQKILDSVGAYEVIEQNPYDKYLPSYLVYSMHESSIFHVLFAADVFGDNVRIVTAYYPNPQEWEKDLRTRRRS